jgi:hypothetical protein
MRSLVRVVLVCFSALFVVMLTADVGGAATIATVPWGTDSPGGISYDGECNEVYVSSPGTGWTWEDGFKVQISCQYVEPASWTPYCLGPEMAASNTWGSNGSSYVNVGTSAGWRNVGSVCWYGYDNTSVASCTPTATAGAAEPVLWYSVRGRTDCSTGSGVTPSGLTGGTSALAAVGRVWSMSVGPPETVGGGSYVAVSMNMQWQFTANPNDSSVGGSGLGHPDIQPVAPFSSEGPCATSGLTAGNDEDWDGVALGNPPSSGNGWYDAVEAYSSAGGEESLQLDSVSCKYPLGFTDQNIWYPAMPTNDFTGGTATGAVVPCSLQSISQPTAQNSTNTVIYGAGTAYSFEFTYSGPVNEIVVDPVDEGGGNDGPVGDSNYIGQGITSNTDVDGYYFPQDAVIAAATGSPQTVSVTFSVSGSWEPEFYCVYGGNITSWGDSTDGTNIPQPTVCGQETFCTSSGSLSDCFSQSGIGLSPGSWVPGLWQMGTCVLGWLFVPSSTAVTNLTGLFSISSDVPAGTSATAGQWLGSLTAFATELPSTAVGQIETAADAGCGGGSGPSISYDGASETLCSGVAASVSGAGFSIVDALVSAFFVAMVGMLLFQLVRRVLTKNPA